MFFPLARFIEFYGPQRMLAVPLLGLNTVFLPRSAFALLAGFPAYLSTRFAGLAIRQGYAVIFASQMPSLFNHGDKSRVPHHVWLPAQTDRSVSSR